MVRRQGVASAALRGILWAFFATAGARLLSLAGLAVLARLLAPQDFGLLAFGLVVLTYLETVGDLGTGMALIHWPRRREEAAQITFWMNLAMGWFWFALCIAVAPAVAAFFRSPAGEEILRILAWSFPLKALGNTHDALCQRDLRFRSRFVPEVGMAAGKMVLSILLALQGLGVWSLVYGHLAGVALWTLLLWVVVPWRPRLAFPGDLAGPILRYGRGIVAVNVVAAVVHHADLVVVGRMLGAAALGLYQMAYKVPEMTLTVLLWVVSRVLFPAFSRLREEGNHLGEAYLAALRYVSLVMLPAAATLAVVARPLTLTLFGPQWEPAVPILRLLALYVGLRSLGTHAGDVLKATGRSGLLAALGVIKAVVLIPALIAGAGWGASGVAGALAGVTLFTVLLNWAVISRMVSLPLRVMVRALGPGAGATGMVLAVLWIWGRLAGALMGPGFLAGALVLGATAFLLAVWRLAPEVFHRGMEIFSPEPRVPPLPVDEGLPEAKGP